MPVRWSEATLRKHAARVEGAVVAPEARKQAREALGELRPPLQGPQERVGYFGSRLHCFRWDRKMGSWLSGCGLMSRSEIVESLPDGLQEQQACACLERE